MLEDFPQFEGIVFSVYKKHRPTNVTIINNLLASETDIPGDVTIGVDESSSISVQEIVQIGTQSCITLTAADRAMYFWHVTRYYEKMS